MGITTKVKRAWNAFTNNEDSGDYWSPVGSSTMLNPSRPHSFYTADKSIISSIYTRIGVDVAGINIRHVKIDENKRYNKDMVSSLNQRLTYEPNLDQGPRAFRQDIASTLFTEGVAAIVPVDTSVNPNINAKFDIYSLRVGIIKEWFPKHVKVSLYNEDTGNREDVMLEKKIVAIVENPLYAVMNEPNSTLQRLLRKLHYLDVIDEQSSSGKLDLIIQLPYTIKSEARRQQANQRREDIEMQLKGSQYGIAYTDGTEKITQLNRPAENNLQKQVEYLIEMLYNQLGITEAVMNGTADEEAMLRYFSRTIEPILDAVIEAMQRSFIGVVGTENKERVQYFRDLFKLVPLNEIAVIADKFSRNEIMTANEIRGFMGIPPAEDPKADDLRNSNMPAPETAEVESSE